MAQSPEYPDLRWMQPRSWTDDNRTAGQARVIVIHTTEGSAHGQSAMDGAKYDQRRTDGTSAHYYVDSSGVVQCVRTSDRAHTAMPSGNRIGIHYELCGRAKWGNAEWTSEYADAMLRHAARQAARDARKYGIPVRWLSANEVRQGLRGFCGHAQISDAFRESTHTDPGGGFPWPRFLAMVSAELNPIEPKENDMTAAELVAELKKGEESELFRLLRGITWRYPAVDKVGTANDQSALFVFGRINDNAQTAADAVVELERKLIEVTGRLSALAEQVGQILEAVQELQSTAPPAQSSATAQD